MSDLFESDRGELHLEPHAYYDAVDRRPWHAKMWQRLGFGVAYAPRPDDSEHWIVTGVWVQLGYLDRLRMLLTNRLHVEICVTTDNDAGRTSSTSAAKVLPPGNCQLRENT
jgi:hypothetical protein